MLRLLSASALLSVCFRCLRRVIRRVTVAVLYYPHVTDCSYSIRGANAPDQWVNGSLNNLGGV
jgi:hypothetical protein